MPNVPETEIPLQDIKQVEIEVNPTWHDAWSLWSQVVLMFIGILAALSTFTYSLYRSVAYDETETFSTAQWIFFIVLYLILSLLSQLWQIKRMLGRSINGKRIALLKSVNALRSEGTAKAE